MASSIAPTSGTVPSTSVEAVDIAAVRGWLLALQSHIVAAMEAADVTTVTGGRVLCVTALGDSTRAAQQRAYETLRQVHFDGEQHRTDIGHRAIQKR